MMISVEECTNQLDPWYSIEFTNWNSMWMLDYKSVFMMEKRYLFHFINHVVVRACKASNNIMFAYRWQFTIKSAQSGSLSPY
jgi:hypothetical protein